MTVSFHDAALTLKVTPQITSANTDHADLGRERDADFSRQVNNVRRSARNVPSRKCWSATGRPR